MAHIKKKKSKKKVAGKYSLKITARSYIKKTKKKKKNAWEALNIKENNKVIKI